MAKEPGTDRRAARPTGNFFDTGDIHLRPPAGAGSMVPPRGGQTPIDAA